MGGAGEKREHGQIADDSTTHQELGNTERQNSSMSVTVCRRSSAQDFLRDADCKAPILENIYKAQKILRLLH
jgi:hypothetical protein